MGSLGARGHDQVGDKGVALVERSDSEAFCHVAFDLWALQLMDDLSTTVPPPKK